MVWNKCEITFNTGISGVFCSEDIVTGTVLIEFGRKQKVEYVNFEVYGECHVQWTRASPTVPYIRNYELKKKVFQLELHLNGVNGERVEKGVHQTNFLFSLPEGLPSSFEGSCGYTRYWAKLEGKSPHWFSKRVLVPFIVANKVDLNAIPGFLTTTHHQIERELLLAGKFSANLKLYTGFAPGQRMPFEVTIGNEKSVTISRLRISLIQLVAYNSNSGYANEERKICHTEIDKVPTGKWEVINMSLMIKPCVPSTINLTDPTISVNYVIRIEFNFPFHFTVTEDIPVTVASIHVFHQYDKN